MIDFSRKPMKPQKSLLTVSERKKQREIMNEKTGNCVNHLTLDDIRILKLVEDEYHRRGQFKRLYPSTDAQQYTKYFESQTYYDKLVAQWCMQKDDGKRIELLRQKNASDALSNALPSSSSKLNRSITRDFSKLKI